MIMTTIIVKINESKNTNISIMIITFIIFIISITIVNDSSKKIKN